MACPRPQSARDRVGLTGAALKNQHGSSGLSQSQNNSTAGSGLWLPPNPCQQLPTPPKGGRPMSAGGGGGRPVRGRGQDLPRRGLEEELQPQPLSPVPTSLATPLEKQVAEAIGLPTSGRGATVPRLPIDVESCRHGGRCCWRWLARVALEHISGNTPSRASLPQMVGKVKEELRCFRAEHEEVESALGSAQRAEQAFSQLQIAHAAAEGELAQLRAMQRDMGRLQAEVQCLQVAAGRQTAVEEALRLESAKLRSDLRESDQKVVELERRVVVAEGDAASRRVSEDALKQQTQELHKELLKKDTELSKLKPGGNARGPSGRRRSVSRRGRAK